MLISKGGITLSQITEQPNTWQKAVKIYNKHRETLLWIKKMKFNQVIFLGAGVSYYAALYSSFLFRSIARIQSYAFQASDIYFSQNVPFDARLRTLVIAFSRRGYSDETLWALEYIKKSKPEVKFLSISCEEESPLSKICDKSVVMNESVDDSPIPLKSFSTLIFLLNLFAGALGGNGKYLKELSQIPKIIDIKEQHNIVSKMMRLQDFKKIIFAGAGANLGLAAYASLVMKEMSLTFSQYIHSFEIRHNNFLASSMDTLVVYYLTDRLKKQELASMRDFAKMKSQILLMAEDLEPIVEAGVEYSIKLKSGLSPFARVMLAIPYLQLLAFRHALSIGKNPDKPLQVVEVVNFKSKPEFLEEVQEDSVSKHKAEDSGPDVKTKESPGLSEDKKADVQESAQQ